VLSDSYRQLYPLSGGALAESSREWSAPAEPPARLAAAPAAGIPAARRISAR
jgi:hypothetical protein